ncbi:MAG: hypothetical protein HC789_18015 [Microcoleus sp. CSU_2_2]|nr:hypothetical protein [Microcoleus sp. CSU_2_2]
MRRYVQLSLQTKIKRATHNTIYNGSESPGFGIICSELVRVQLIEMR